MAVVGLVRFPTSIQQPVERFEFIRTHVSQLSRVTFGHLTRQSVQELDPIRGDTNFDNASIFRQSLPVDQPASLQAIEQTCHIGSSRNEPRPQLQGRQTSGVDRFEQTQRVVLLGREVVLAEETIFVGLEEVVCPPQVEVRRLFDGIKLTPRDRGGLRGT